MELQQLVKNWTKEMAELKDEIREYENSTGKSAISGEARLQAISEILADIKLLNLPHVNNSLPICNVESCEKWQLLAKHKANLIAENEQLRQRLIEAGLENPAILIDVSRKA